MNILDVKYDNFVDSLFVNTDEYESKTFNKVKDFKKKYIESLKNNYCVIRSDDPLKKQVGFKVINKGEVKKYLISMRKIVEHLHLKEIDEKELALSFVKNYYKRILDIPDNEDEIVDVRYEIKDKMILILFVMSEGSVSSFLEDDCNVLPLYFTTIDGLDGWSYSICYLRQNELEVADFSESWGSIKDFISEKIIDDDLGIK
jgi:hypothetical protein